MPVWTQEEISLLKEYYPYIPTKCLCWELNRKRETITAMAMKIGLKKIENGKCYVNHFYFDEWNPNMAWMLGFWATDGCAHKEGVKHSIIFAQADKNVLEMTKREFDSDHKISKLSNHLGVSYQFRFTSNTIYQRLLDIFGCEIQRKSLTLKWPVELPDKYFRDFVRGLIDGDGSVTFCDNTPTISFTCASDDFIRDLVRKIKLYTGLSGALCAKKRGTSLLSYGSFKAVCLAKFLYYDDNVLAIDRKHKKANEVSNYKLTNVPRNISKKAIEMFQDIIVGSYKKVPKSKTGYWGVSPLSDKWRATLNGEYLGIFDTPKIAAVAYDKRAKEVHGCIARLNFR